jgi:signal transduction histidine kinase
VYLLSHDLRTFAGNPQSLALLILEEHPSDTVKEYAELINESSKQQFAYIENFIKLLKDQDQFIKKTNQKNRIIPKELLISVTDLVRQSLTKKNIKLVSTIEVEELFLKIDAKSLIRVLSNLVDNAIKFSHRDSEIKIHIYTESHKIFFKVTDAGIGFDLNQREELFDKFTKIGRSGTSGEPSTGIGLYLCKNIIEKHGGTLNANSDIGKGATFMIVFDI